MPNSGYLQSDTVSRALMRDLVEAIRNPQSTIDTTMV